MAYAMRKIPRSSFMTDMTDRLGVLGLGEDVALTAPVLQLPPQPTPPPNSSTPLAFYALYAVGGLVAYWLLLKKR